MGLGQGVAWRRLPQILRTVLGKKRPTLCSPKSRQRSWNGEKLEIEDSSSGLGCTYSQAELLWGNGLPLGKMNCPSPEVSKQRLDVHGEGFQRG